VPPERRLQTPPHVVPQAARSRRRHRSARGRGSGGSSGSARAASFGRGSRRIDGRGRSGRYISGNDQAYVGGYGLHSGVGLQQERPDERTKLEAGRTGAAVDGFGGRAHFSVERSHLRNRLKKQSNV
jgi:hypothetical protein